MNTKLMQPATFEANDTGLRRGILAPVCLSAQSPVYVLLEPPSP
jgi:hypothetical protein